MEVDVATCEQISHRIEELMGEEHMLSEAESRGEATEGDRRRLDELKLTLDQCCDLLRQPRALEEFAWTPMRRWSGRPRWSSATSSSASLHAVATT
jgi:Protein of unknown function (DUF2630)